MPPAIFIIAIVLIATGTLPWWLLFFVIPFAAKSACGITRPVRHNIRDRWQYRDDKPKRTAQPGASPRRYGLGSDGEIVPLD